MSVFRDFKLSMLLGRHSRFLQPYRIKKARTVKHSIDEGSTFSIAVSVKLRLDRLLIIPVNFGNKLNLEQNERSRTLRDCITADMQGRSVRLLQPNRFKDLSLLSCPIDGWISTNRLHSRSLSSLRSGTPEKSGVLMRFWEYLRSMYFKFFESCYQKNKK